MTPANFDPELIRKHNVNGPRYTSYPTANEFKEGDWKAAYQQSFSSTDMRALSLYLHVPFCATICYYCACNKINTANHKKAEKYVDYLIEEMQLHSALLDSDHSVEQLHFGGGTPTFLTDDQFDRLFLGMHKHFNLAVDESRDFSVEIDPRGLDPRRITMLSKLGINRISIGVQDFDPAVQIAVNRVQSLEETSAVMQAARDNGIQSINIDLINGLPHQTVQGFNRTLDKIIELDPDRLSLYSYAHLPERFKTQRQIKAQDLPDAERKLSLLQTAIERLAQAGYVYVGMDHFAKSGDSLAQALEEGTMQRNFQGYSSHGHCELIGLGVSSIGKVGHVYTQNYKTLADYYRALDSSILPIERGFESDRQDWIVGEVIQDLMCKFKIDMSAFESRTGHNFKQYFLQSWPQLEQFERDGLLELDGTQLTVSGSGRYLIRNICMCFDTYLRNETEKFSKAI